MRLLLDENVKRSIHDLLTQEGHDVLRVQDAIALGTVDEAVVEYCLAEDRFLLTNDDDLLTFDDRPGILFLDDQTASPRAVATAVQRVETLVGPDELAGQVVHVPDGWV